MGLLTTRDRGLGRRQRNGISGHDRVVSHALKLTQNQVPTVTFVGQPAYSAPQPTAARHSSSSLPGRFRAASASYQTLQRLSRTAPAEARRTRRGAAVARRSPCEQLGRDNYQQEAAQRGVQRAFLKQPVAILKHLKAHRRHPAAQFSASAPAPATHRSRHDEDVRTAQRLLFDLNLERRAGGPPPRLLDSRSDIGPSSLVCDTEDETKGPGRDPGLVRPRRRC